MLEHKDKQLFSHFVDIFLLNNVASCLLAMVKAQCVAAPLNESERLTNTQITWLRTPC